MGRPGGATPGWGGAALLDTAEVRSHRDLRPPEAGCWLLARGRSSLICCWRLSSCVCWLSMLLLAWLTNCSCCCL